MQTVTRIWARNAAQDAKRGAVKQTDPTGGGYSAVPLPTGRMLPAVSAETQGLAQCTWNWDLRAEYSPIRGAFCGLSSSGILFWALPECLSYSGGPASILPHFQMRIMTAACQPAPPPPARYVPYMISTDLAFSSFLSLPFSPTHAILWPFLLTPAHLFMSSPFLSILVASLGLHYMGSHLHVPLNVPGIGMEGQLSPFPQKAPLGFLP